MLMKGNLNGAFAFIACIVSNAERPKSVDAPPASQNTGSNYCFVDFSCQCSIFMCVNALLFYAQVFLLRPKQNFKTVEKMQRTSHVVFNFLFYIKRHVNFNHFIKSFSVLTRCIAEKALAKVPVLKYGKFCCLTSTANSALSKNGVVLILKRFAATYAVPVIYS